MASFRVNFRLLVFGSLEYLKISCRLVQNLANFNTTQARTRKLRIEVNVMKRKNWLNPTVAVQTITIQIIEKLHTTMQFWNSEIFCKNSIFIRFRFFVFILYKLLKLTRAIQTLFFTHAFRSMNYIYYTHILLQSTVWLCFLISFCN